MFADFINQYGMEILYTVLMAIVGYLGVVAKKLCTKYINDKTKQSVAKTVVQFVEQVYKDLHGEEKFNKALETAIEMLTEKGIVVSRLEIEALIESAVAEFNNAFNKATKEGE